MTEPEDNLTTWTLTFRREIGGRLIEVSEAGEGSDPPLVGAAGRLRYALDMIEQGKRPEDE